MEQFHPGPEDRRRSSRGAAINVLANEAKTRPAPSSSRLPALAEAVFWTLAYPLAQGTVLILFLVLLVTAAYGLAWPGRDELLQLALDLNLDGSFLLVGVTTLGVLFLIVPAVRWRLGGDFRRQLGWHAPRREEWIFALATIAPIAILGDAVYTVAKSWWGEFGLDWSLASVVQTSSLDHLHQSFTGVPYPVLIVALALGPALGEELVFRGVIGRRLIARLGVAPGVIVTSACFAAAHLSPPHVLATFPVAILLHVLYLQTRTIWVPILVHFGNNLLAVSMVRFQVVPEEPVSPVVFAGICVYLFAILALLEAHRRDWRPSSAPGAA